MPQNFNLPKVEEGKVSMILIKKVKELSSFLPSLLFSLIACFLLLAPFLFYFTSSSPIHPFSDDQATIKTSIRKIDLNSHGRGPCSSIAGDTICCDRSGYHSDVCFMQGDVRMHSPSSTIFLIHSPSHDNSSVAPAAPSMEEEEEEKIRPYPRKWSAILEKGVTELHLRRRRSNDDNEDPLPLCDVHHDVPALFFSAGGYTGNVFHDFNDGLVPLYITSHHLQRKVVLVVLDYREWWNDKYQEILAQLSDYPPLDFSSDTRTHCFPGAIVGLRSHGVLSVDSAQLKENKTMQDFGELLAKAYEPKIAKKEAIYHPKLVLISRNGTRMIENEAEVVQLGEGVGFNVEVLKPDNKMAMSKIFKVLRSCDVMMGVHGAALTHFIFMKMGSAFIQIVPVGTDDLARMCYGEAASKMGFYYEEYKVLPRESSLYWQYGEDDPVVKNPKSVKAKGGWEVTKEVYLQSQNVRLDKRRLRQMLVRVFEHVILH